MVLNRGLTDSISIDCNTEGNLAASLLSSTDTYRIKQRTFGQRSLAMVNGTKSTIDNNESYLKQTIVTSSPSFAENLDTAPDIPIVIVDEFTNMSFEESNKRGDEKRD